MVGTALLILLAQLKKANNSEFRLACQLELVDIFNAMLTVLTPLLLH
jgi:hypothetical protein